MTIDGFLQCWVRQADFNEAHQELTALVASERAAVEKAERERCAGRAEEHAPQVGYERGQPAVTVAEGLAMFAYGIADDIRTAPGGEG